jgi:hypothetical protein
MTVEMAVAKTQTFQAEVENAIALTDEAESEDISVEEENVPSELTNASPQEENSVQKTQQPSPTNTKTPVLEVTKVPSPQPTETSYQNSFQFEDIPDGRDFKIVPRPPYSAIINFGLDHGKSGGLGTLLSVSEIEYYYDASKNSPEEIADYYVSHFSATRWELLSSGYGSSEYVFGEIYLDFGDINDVIPDFLGINIYISTDIDNDYGLVTIVLWSEHELGSGTYDWDDWLEP